MVQPTDSPLVKRIHKASSELLDQLGVRPRVALLLGTGHGAVSAQLKNKKLLHRQDLPGGMLLAEESHLMGGLLEGVPVVIGDPPLAAYDGHAAQDVTFPVRVLQAMGCELLILTAGASSLSRHLEPGAIAVVEDHLNFSNLHPLQGPHTADLGPRFPDLSAPYPAKWRRRAREVGQEIGLNCMEAVFAAVPGPSMPTRAEYRFLRRAGADLVGMSLVPEVLAAVHSGFEVLALVGILETVHVESSEPTDIELMLDAAELAAPRMASLINGIVASLDQ